jgi:hypothetical protein
MAFELAKLCSKILLLEGEKAGILVSERDVAKIREIGGRCLIGIIGVEKSINGEVLSLYCLGYGIWRCLWFLRRYKTIFGFSNSLRRQIEKR